MVSARRRNSSSQDRRTRRRRPTFAVRSVPRLAHQRTVLSGARVSAETSVRSSQSSLVVEVTTKRTPHFDSNRESYKFRPLIVRDLKHRHGPKRRRITMSSVGGYFSGSEFVSESSPRFRRIATRMRALSFGVTFPNAMKVTSSSLIPASVSLHKSS